VKIALLSYAAVQALLVEADLRMGPNGIPRSTYCFRHTYATCRLSEGVDVYILSERMGTSVKMIENHYGHVNTIKHADRVLMGIGGWEARHADMDAEGDVEEATAKARQAAKSKQSVRPAHFKR
jgi:integrase